MRRALRRTTASLLVTVALQAAAPAAAAGAPDAVRTAEREVAALQEQVDRTAERLAAGAQRLEDSRADLARVQVRLDTARRQALVARQRAAAAREALLQGVAAAYRSPVPPSFLLALAGPEEFRAAVSAQSDLSRVHGRHDDLLRTARVERRRADDAADAVERLADDARRQAEGLREQVDALRSAAADGERELRTASRRLAAARAEAARRAERCSGPVVEAANGFLPASALCPLADAPGHALRADAAADFARLNDAARAELGRDLCVTDSYRSYARQVDVFARKPALAAVPGTSRHGWGVALDLGCGVESFGTAAYRWMQQNGPRFGWVHPAWAEPGGSMPEPWHWEHVG